MKHILFSRKIFKVTASQKKCGHIHQQNEDETMARIKRYALILTIMLFPLMASSVMSTAVFADSWTVIEGTEPVGLRGGSDYATAIAKDRFNNYFFTGGYNSRTSPAYHVEYEMYDVFIAKLDSFGNFVWKVVLNSGDPTSITSNDLGIAITVDYAGNVFVMGKTGGDLSGEGIVPHPYQRQMHFIAKYDNHGNQQWIHQFGTFGSTDYLADMTIDARGMIYIVGSAFKFDPATGNRTSEFDTVVYQYDTYGNQIKMTSFPSPSTDIATSSTIDANNNLYISGWKLDINGGYSNAYETWVKKLSPTGTLLWEKESGVLGWDKATDMTYSDAANELVVVGNQRDQPFVFRFSPDNGELIRKTYGRWFDYYRAVKTDGAGSIYITGSYGKNAVEQGNWGSDISFTKFSSTGDLLNEASVGTVNTRDVGFGIVVDAAGNYVIAGSVAGDLNGVPSQATMTSSDIVLLKNQP